MNANRVEQIKESLAGFGTAPDQGYSNKEIIDRLIGLENALLAGVYEKNHAENMRPQDLTKHFAALAEEFGLLDNPTYRRFTANMQELDLTVKTLISGQKGEQLARSSLRPLSFDRNVEILYNIALENEDMKTEYDAIVIAPYGLFAVEVKNWGGNVTMTKDGFLTRSGGTVSANLAARMLVKETLLRDCLGELFPETFHNILLLPENKTHLHDEYHRQLVGYGAGIVNCIRSCGTPQTRITEAQIRAIVEKLTAAHAAQPTYCTVKCNEIIEDFALLMAKMEAASVSHEQDETTFSVIAAVEIPDEIGDLLSGLRNSLGHVNWRQVGKVAGAAAGVAFTLAAGVAASRMLGRKSR